MDAGRPAGCEAKDWRAQRALSRPQPVGGAARVIWGDREESNLGTGGHNPALYR